MGVAIAPLFLIHYGDAGFSSIGRRTPTRFAHGAVAQLGERFNGIEEVRGSNPLSSTKYIFDTTPQPALIQFALTVDRKASALFADQ